MWVLLHILLLLSIIQYSEAGNKSQETLRHCRDEEKLSISLCAPFIEDINQYRKLYTDRIHDPMYYQNLEKLYQAVSEFLAWTSRPRPARALIRQLCYLFSLREPFFPSKKQPGFDRFQNSVHYSHGMTPKCYPRKKSRPTWLERA
ncbi:hypothetical protein B9Z55_020656 [Caenorhabditis nigoni]|uniref:Uncharacterized protein n=1 Tax=Caenorhabditis nigoni TaxID=1611254 RepID=A0A2G5TNJ1_9PELO|nr:hypothetical protein B9Z55_020656 [Caenorhabditis nigoni]